MNSWSVASFLCLLSVAGAGCKGPEAGPSSTAAPSASEASSAAAAPMAAPEAPKGKDTSPIKIGILHSLSGTMAISETSLKDVALMTIDAINKKGGVLGRKLEPVVVDPASNW
ncbi:MAG: transporter substrate-binding protein, partial [Polyangiaceae bacterium]